jgi:hypothetical protein
MLRGGFRIPRRGSLQKRLNSKGKMLKEDGADDDSPHLARFQFFILPPPEEMLNSEG